MCLTTLFAINDALNGLLNQTLAQSQTNTPIIYRDEIDPLLALIRLLEKYFSDIAVVANDTKSSAERDFELLYDDYNELSYFWLFEDIQSLAGDIDLIFGNSMLNLTLDTIAGYLSSLDSDFSSLEGNLNNIQSSIIPFTVNGVTQLLNSTLISDILFILQGIQTSLLSVLGYVKSYNATMVAVNSIIYATNVPLTVLYNATSYLN